MTRSPKLLALLFALCAFASVAYAKDDGHDKDRAAITADYILGDTADESKDADASVANLTDDFQGIDEKGVVEVHSKAEARQQAQKVFSVAEKITSHTTVSDIAFTQEGATVTSINDEELTAAVGGQTHTLTDKSTSHDEWIKSGDVWLEKSSTITVARHFIDGQPAP